VQGGIIVAEGKREGLKTVRSAAPYTYTNNCGRSSAVGSRVGNRDGTVYVKLFSSMRTV
jgi:hypothetical protein